MITNGDFESGLTGWRVVSGKAFAGQPVQASAIGARDVEIDGKPLVTLGGDYWHTPFPIGQHGSHLIRVATKASGILESRRFTITERYLAYRLGGSAGGRAAIEMRLPAATARKAGIKALDSPDADGYVAAFVAEPSGSDVLREEVWDLASRRARRSLVGETARLRLRVAGTTKRPQRLLVDHVRLLRRRPARFRPPLWGWADIHCHPMAQAGFGDVMAGHMHGPVEDLGSCLTIHGHRHASPARPVAMATGDGGRFNDGALATTGWTTGSPEPHDELGFRGWPAFDEVTHIKTHQEWIRRAYEGGQRLMCALVVHNELLAGLSTMSGGKLDAQSDRDVVEPQVQMLREFVVHNKDWCGLATTPAQARELIEANKMAFVLGIETDSINGWVRFSDFPEGDAPGDRDAIHARIHGYFRYLRDLGIVQINLIHLTDNAFGGMAVYDMMFMISSWTRTGRLPDTEDGFSFAEDGSPGRPFAEEISRPVTLESKLWSMVQPVMQAVGLNPPPPPPVRPVPIGDRNVRGLTVAGQVALLEAMRLGMVIDTDHMSEHGEQMAFKVATTMAGKPYPLVAAHNGARALAPRPPSGLAILSPYSRFNPHLWPSEGQKSDTQIGHILATGGMFGHGIAGADSASYSATVPNDCPGSSKTVAQGLEYVASRLPEIPIALGTDWNALLPGPGPRFGPRAANGLDGEMEHGNPTTVRAERKADALAQDKGVLYDSAIRDCRTYRFASADLYGGTAIEGEDRYLWQALALDASGEDLTDDDLRASLLEPGDTEPPGLDIAKGMNDIRPTPDSDFLRAGEIIAHPTLIAPNAHVQALVDAMAEIRPLWDAMRAAPAPGALRLRRSTAGPKRDFDYNIDGLSHYGMLPDMLQDLKNVGLSSSVLDGFFRSAERYIEVWERSASLAATIPHP